jgi:hypothetical protein
VNDCPNAKVVTSGNTATCGRVPVKYCSRLLPATKVVVPPAVAVVEYPGIIFVIQVGLKVPKFAMSGSITKYISDIKK